MSKNMVCYDTVFGKKLIPEFKELVNSDDIYWVKIEIVDNLPKITLEVLDVNFMSKVFSCDDEKPFLWDLRKLLFRNNFVWKLRCKYLARYPTYKEIQMQAFRHYVVYWMTNDEEERKDADIYMACSRKDYSSPTFNLCTSGNGLYTAITHYCKGKESKEMDKEYWEMITKFNKLPEGMTREQWDKLPEKTREKEIQNSRELYNKAILEWNKKLIKKYVTVIKK